MFSKILTISLTTCIGVGAIIAPTVVTSVINNLNNSKSQQYVKSEFDVTNQQKYSNINKFFKSQTISLFFANFVDSTSYEGSNGTGWLLPNQYSLLNKQIYDNSINNLKFYIATNFHVINGIYNNYDKLFISFFENPNSEEIINGKYLNIGATKNNVKLILNSNNNSNDISLLRDCNDNDPSINNWLVNPPRPTWKIQPWWDSTFKQSQDEKPWKIKKSFNDISILEINISKKNNAELVNFLKYSSMMQEYLSNHSMPLNINNNSNIQNQNDPNPGLSFFIGSFPIYNGDPKWVLSRYPLIEYKKDQDGNLIKMDYFNHVCNSSCNENNCNCFNNQQENSGKGCSCKRVENASSYYYSANFYTSPDLNVDLIDDNGKKISGVFKDTSRQLSFERLDIGSGSSGSLAIIVNESLNNYNDDWLSIKHAGIWWGTYSSYTSTNGMINLLKTDDFCPDIKNFDIKWKGYDFFKLFNYIVQS